MSEGLKILKMIKDEIPRTMGDLDYQLLYDDICKAYKLLEKEINGSAK